MNRDKCINEKCTNYDEDGDNNCLTEIDITICPNHLIENKEPVAEVPCSDRVMFLIIDEDYKIYKAPVLSGYVRSEARKGNLSVIDIRRMKGMNCLKLHSENGFQGDFGENEWSDIQLLPRGFKIDET